MAKTGFSPVALFLALGAVALGAGLAASHPGSRALFIVDWAQLFLMAAPLAALLFAVERRLSRARRREEPASYPYPGAVALGLFGVSVFVLALANGQLRRTTRVVRPAVHGWLAQDLPIPTMFGVPQAQSAAFRAKKREAYVAVEAWWDRETELKLPVTDEQLRRWEEPGRHVVELVVAQGALGVEFIEDVRVVAVADE